MTGIAALLVGITVSLGVVGMHSLLFSPSALVQRVAGPTPVSKGAQGRTMRHRLPLRPREGLSGRLWGRPGQGMALMLEQAGIPLRVAEYLALRLGMASVFACLAALMKAPWWMLPLPAIAGYWLPGWVVRQQRRIRIAKIEKQLLEALPLVINALRSGYSFLQALDFASKQISRPLAIELAHTVQEIQLGADIDTALSALGRRVGSQDLELVLTAILIQRQVGGNLAQLLSTVEQTMRERVKLRGEIRTLTSQQRLSALIIGSLPVLLTGGLFLLNPDYIGLLFTTMVGRILLAVAAAMEVIGILGLRKIMQIEV